MDYWLIRTTAPSIAVYGRQSVVIRASRRTAIRPNDQIAFVTGSGEEARFSWVAEASEIAEFSKIENGRQVVATTVSLRDARDLPADAEVDLLKFSLRFVWNLDEPWRHFRRGYRRLQKRDLETILEAVPFVARTVYHEFLRALPRPQSAEFLADELMLQALGAFDNSFVARLERLRAFIQARVVAATHLIIELEKAALAIVPDTRSHLLGEETGEGTVELRRADDLASQARNAEQFTAAWANTPAVQESGRADVIEQALYEAGDSAVTGREERFETLFRDAS